MKATRILLIALIYAIPLSAAAQDPKTTFQTGSGWRDILDNRADAVMVYGPYSLEKRLQSWKEKGYKTDFMTGIAWGSYEDYFTGKWDGATHYDEGQVRADGTRVNHNPTVPYIVPTLNYLEYFKEAIIKKVIDAGVTDIYLEEPEFWAFSGYSESFKREWQDYYGTPWEPQHASPEATYLSNKLKYHLYYRALEECFSFAKEYGRSKGMEIKCFVPTHSLINYSQWQIVSPEASLASLDCLDGYIAQVWTGTSRTPLYYNGQARERVFETAFFEYGCMSSMTAPTGRKMFFLTDPIEDAARDWADYKRNYEATFTAQLLHPQTASYEVMPWPERIYGGRYRVSADSKETVPISEDYATQMQVMINTLNHMPQSDAGVSGSPGIGVLMANSLMFQRFPTHDGYDDPALSNFFGLSLPLLLKGIPAHIVHIENLGFRKSLKDTKLLLMSYSNMKPLDPEAHSRLEKWVRRGGVLIYSGTDKDPFQTVKEWWNTSGNSFACPSDHLFSLMGIDAGAPQGTYRHGRGKVIILRHDPKEYLLTENGDRELMETIGQNYRGRLEYKNNFLLRRGPYVIAATLAESISSDPLVIDGRFVDLYDPSLPVIDGKTVPAGTQSLLFDLSSIKKREACIVASAARAYDISSDRESFSFVEKGPAKTKCVTRVRLPWKPSDVRIDGISAYEENCWDETSHTYLLTHPNSPDGTKVIFLK